MLAHPACVLIAIRSVDHDQEPILGLSVYDEVVDDAPVFLTHQGVDGLSGIDLCDVVGQQPLEIRFCTCA